MPDDILDRCDICKDTTIQLLTAEQNLVHHRQGNGVGTGEALLRHVRVVAVDVVDLNVGRRGQRVGDDTFLRVGLLQVVLGFCVGYIQTELQPLLQLSVEVGADRETVEVRTDNSTLLVHVST